MDLMLFTPDPDMDEDPMPIFWRRPQGGWVLRLAYRIWPVRCP